MPKNKTLSIKIEEELKKEVETTLNRLGMNITDAITIFFKQIVLNNGIPFEIKKTRYNKETIEAIKEAKKIMEHPEEYKTYNDIYEIMEEIELEEKQV